MAAYRIYIIVWLALLVLTAVTWGVSYINLGMGNVTVALIIASVKAGLVALYENRLVWAFALVPLFFLALIIFGTLSDTMFR